MARRRTLDRRLFLRGLGGACVAAPFLGSIAARRVHAEEAAAPKRLIAMFTHYGCITTRFFPAKSHGPLTADDLGGTLRPLAPYVDKLLVPRGIRAMNEWSASLELGQGNDPHTQVAGSYFTCQPVTPNTNDPFSFAKETKFEAKPIGRSLDHVIAEQLSPSGLPLLLHVGNRTDSPQSCISYADAEVPYTGYGERQQIMDLLTGLFPGATPSADSYAAARGKSVTDLVQDDLETLERFDMSEADRRKLEAWKALLNDTGKMVGSPLCTPETAELLGATQANVDAWATSESANDVLAARIDGSITRADLYSNLAALAAVCNANPVIVLKYPAGHLFSALGFTVESASLSHRLDNAGMSGTCLEDVIEMLLKIDNFYAERFGYLVGLLNDIDEGDGKVLDNSAAIWFNEMSDGSAHNLNNLPIIQAGGLGGYFKTGWAVNVENGSPDLSRGNSEAFCGDDVPNQINGINRETGTDPAVANAPINKYFCTLMNGLGVRAGEDGFPVKNGQAEVTHYGRYDKTEDFFGGDANPPKIHDPGEFSALRAGS